VEQAILFGLGLVARRPEQSAGIANLLCQFGYLVATGPVADEDGKVVIGVGGIDRRQRLALAGYVEEVTHVDPALDRPAMPFDLDIFLLGGGDATKDGLRVAGEVHRQQRSLDLPAVESEQLAPGGLLGFVVPLDMAAGLLE